MKKQKISAVFMITLGLLVILVPQVLFPPCDKMMELASGNEAPMKCYWTARADLWLGVLAVVDGALALPAETNREKLLLDFMFMAIGMVVILVPLRIIGVCASKVMPCHMGMKPALVICGICILLAGFTDVIVNVRRGSLLEDDDIRKYTL